MLKTVLNKTFFRIITERLHLSHSLSASLRFHCAIVQKEINCEDYNKLYIMTPRHLLFIAACTLGGKINNGNLLNANTCFLFLLNLCAFKASV